MNPRGRMEVAQRAAARRRREAEAARLRDEVPRLATLRFDVEERRARGAIHGARYVRRIVVEHAPGIFYFACADRDCRDGGHDLTHLVLAALSRGETRFEGAHGCDGRVRAAACASVLCYVAEATYR